MEPEIGELSCHSTFLFFISEPYIRLTFIAISTLWSLIALKSKLQDTFFLCIDTAQEKRVSSAEEEGGEVQLELVEQTLGTLGLREFEICPSRHRRRRRKKKEEMAKQSDGWSTWSLFRELHC